MKKICTGLLFLCLCLLGSTAFSQKDTERPKLSSLGISPSVINNGDSVTVTIEVSEKISTTATNVTIENPSGRQRVYIKSWKHISGNIYTGKTKISDYAQPGIWRLAGLSLYDLASNYWGPDVLQYTFQVNSTNEDLEAPVIHAVSVSPSILKNEDSVTVTIDITDNISGIKGTGFPVKESEGDSYYTTRAKLITPYDNSRVYLDINSWKHIGGNMYAGKAKIPKYAASGTWKIASIVAADNVGNTKTYSYHPSLSNYTFQVNSSSEDITAPRLNSVTISPYVNSGDSVTITVDITDDVSGISYINLDFDSKIIKWKQTGENVYTGKFKIFEYTSATSDLIDYISLWDNAGNGASYKEGLYFNGRYTINPLTPDITPPVLHSLTVAPAVVSKGDSLSVTINITDDVSGISGNGFPKGVNKEEQIVYVNLGHSEISSSYLFIDKWKHMGGDTYQSRVQVPEYVETGKWKALSAFVADIAENATTCEQMIDLSDIVFEVTERTTDINDIVQPKSFTYYPNPARSNEILKIKSPGIRKVSLFTLTGTKISESDFNNEEEVSVQLAGQQSGIYLLEIQTLNGVLKQKLFIK